MSQPTDGNHLEALDISKDPIKHYVRLNGWITNCKSMLEKLKEKGVNRPYGLRYFTLCGKEGIDIYLLEREKIIISDGRKFPSVFFCEKYYNDFVEIKSLLGGTIGANLRFESLVFSGRYETEFREHPFDVINLDFSGQCFPKEDAPYSRTLKSIDHLFELHNRYEFKLFLTFKALKSLDNEEAIHILIENVKSNFCKIENYKEQYELRYPDIEEFPNINYGLFLLITIPKIIFGFASNHNMICKCDDKFVYKRTSLSGNDYKIVKYIFSLEPAVNSDNLLGVSNRTDYLAGQYRGSSLDDLGKEIQDVNSILEGQEDLVEDLIEDYESLFDSRVPFGEE